MITLLVLFLAIFSHIEINDAFKLQPRVVHGYKSSQKQFPYYGYLHINRNENTTSGCGSGIISDEWLITAAHCVYNFQNLTVIFGKTNLSEPQEGQGFIPDIEPSSILIHPNYTDGIIFNDVALIHLPGKINFTEYIQPVALQTKKIKSVLNIDVTSMGHGLSNNNSTISPTLKFAYLKIVSCRETYPPLASIDSIFCAQAALSKQATCRGDSGGPVVSRKDGTVIGLVAFGKESCEEGHPQGFTNLYPFLSWIKQSTKLNLRTCWKIQA